MATTEVYYNFVRDRFDAAEAEEREVHRRAGMLLTLDGVMFSILGAAIFQMSGGISSKQGPFIALSLVFLLSAIIFLIWALSPRKRESPSSLSHYGSYGKYGSKSRNKLYGQMIEDIVYCAVEQNGIVKKKSNRYQASLYLNIAGLIVFIIGCFVHLCL